ncbi:MAG: hypothetical protein U0T83_07890 [Bacteriovoracaceae bacterium]
MTKKKTTKTLTGRVKNSKVFTNYRPSLESTAIVNLKEKYDLFINGKFVAPSSKEYFATINPANQKN